MGMTCSTKGKKRNAYRILVGKPEGTRPLQRPKFRCVDNMKIDLRKTGWGLVDWIDLAQDRRQWRALEGSRRSIIDVLSRQLPGRIEKIHENLSLDRRPTHRD
jgi:hypothetical protein